MTEWPAPALHEGVAQHQQTTSNTHYATKARPMNLDLSLHGQRLAASVTQREIPVY